MIFEKITASNVIKIWSIYFSINNEYTVKFSTNNNNNNNFKCYSLLNLLFVSVLTNIKKIKLNKMA